MLFFFYEIAVFPMYLLIAIWGWKVTREYAAMKLTLYLFIGSMAALVGALAMYYAAGIRTFDMLALEHAGFSLLFQQIWFPLVFIGFAVLGGRMPIIIILTLVNVVYGAYIAMVQTDFKYVIGFSSVSHMGLVLMGFATLSRDGFVGAGMQMFSHGVMTALFFAVVGMVYDQVHTREIPKLGGFKKVMPLVAFAFIVGGFVSMGMPGFSGFIAEFPIFMGVWQTTPWIAVIAVVSIVITASYIIRIIGKVFFGDIPDEFEDHAHDVRVLDKVALVLLSVILISIGVYPSVMVPLVESGVNNIMRLLGGA
jgi:NADH-quinone oxidoreductase subunit M